MTKITILDGGMGQELIARAGKATSLWSVQALLDNPEMVREVHDEYFAAGAEIATTNTYSVLPDRLVHHGLADRLTLLQQLACQQAVDARDANGSGLVAGSLGPQGFSYQPDKSPPSDQAAEIYHDICKIQADFVDLYLFETMSSIDQARGGLMGAAGFGKPVWLSLSVDDKDGSKLRSGENLTDVLPLLADYKPAAVLVNCSVPEAVTTAVPILVDHGIPVGAYANGFVSIADTFDHVGATVDELEIRKDLGPKAYADFAQKWVDAGATIIGGCCEVGPAHIALLSKNLSEKQI
ncbi:MAG: homocysteine S-methyltransferase family protein [Amylibacter sp.]